MLVFLQIIRYDTLGACGILLLNFIILIRSCKISEFSCKGSGLCLPLDKYCDGIDQCGDLSDEPKFCTGKYFFNADNTLALFVAAAAADFGTKIILNQKMYF